MMDIKSKPLYIALIVIFFILLASFLYFQQYNFQSNEPKNVETTQTKSNLPGTIVLKMNSNLASEVVVDAVSDSNNIPISAYDVTVHYNHGQLELVDVKGAPDFDIYKTDLQISTDISELIVTGIKALTTEDDIVFTDSTVATFMFKPLVRGEETKIDVVFTPSDTKDSNLMDQESKDILGKAEGVTFTLQK